MIYEFGVVHDTSCCHELILKIFEGPGPAPGRYGPGWRQMAQKTEFYVQAHGGGQVFWKAMAKMDESWKEEKVFNILAH